MSDFVRCPLCGKSFERQLTSAMPFCSERCQRIDLGRWLGEGYSVPHMSDPEDDEEYYE